jgi:hypothetical protein
MQWSERFATVSLFFVSVLVVESLTLSANGIKGNTGWLKKNSKEIGKKRHYGANKGIPQTQRFKRNTNGLASNAQTDQLKLDKRYSSLVGLSVEPKEHVNNGIKLQSTKNPFRETPKVNHHIMVKRNVNTSKLQTQPSATKRSGSLFNIPPVCSGKQSCLARCIGNITEWRSDETLTCYCDTACYEIFNDCCSDYTKYCGEQNPSDISIKKFKWTCEPLGHLTSNPHCEVGEGLWMVSRCADDCLTTKSEENARIL